MSLDFDIGARVSFREGESEFLSVFSWNFTHNMVSLWQHLGIYEALYESHGKRVVDVLPSLREGAKRMIDEGAALSRFDSPNGWGKYADAREALLELLTACEARPLGEISVSR